MKINFERQDLRRIWLVLGAIDKLSSPSLSEIAKVLDMQMSTVQTVIARLNSVQLPAVEVKADADGLYSVHSWGVLNKREILSFYSENA